MSCSHHYFLSYITLVVALHLFALYGLFITIAQFLAWLNMSFDYVPFHIRVS